MECNNFYAQYLKTTKNAEPEDKILTNRLNQGYKIETIAQDINPSAVQIRCSDGSRLEFSRKYREMFITLSITKVMEVCCTSLEKMQHFSDIIGVSTY